MRLFARLLACCLSLSALPALAAQVEGLYDVREPVGSEAGEERAAAMARAVQALAVRLTGDVKAAADPRLQPLLADPQQLVQRYVYEPGSPVMLSVSFDPLLSEQALRAAGLAVWHTERPQVLAWWLQEANGDSLLLVADQDAAADLRAAARNRGVPLVLPIGDLQEQLLASAPWLAQGAADELQMASQAYAADAVLSVVARTTETEWQAGWRLLIGDELLQGTQQAGSRQALAEQVFAEVARVLVRRFAAGLAAPTLQVEISDSDLAQLAQLQRELLSLKPRLLFAEGRRLVFEVTATPAQLRSRLQALGLQERAQPEGAALTPPAAQPARLTFGRP